MVNFYRKSKVTKDVPISEIHSDKYGGLETTAQIRGGRFSEKYALEFQVPDDPTYGAGKLYKLDLGLYTTGLELADNSTAIPKVVAYKIKDVTQSGQGRELFEGVGNKKSDDILVYSAQTTGFSSVSEVFNGKTTSGTDEVTYEPIQRTLFRKEKPYTTPKFLAAYGLQFDGGNHMGGKRGESVGITEETIKTNYGVNASDFGMNFAMSGDASREKTIGMSATIGSGPDWGQSKVANSGKETVETGYTYTQIDDLVSSSSLIVPLLADTDTEVKNNTDEPDAGLYKAVPIEGKAGNDLFVFDNTPAVWFANRDVIDNDTYGNEVTSANSIFEYVRGADEFIGENKKSEGESELFGVGAVRFSNKLQRTGGQSCQMYTFWKQQDDDPVSYPRKQAGGPSNRQETLIAKKNIPLPTKLPARPNWDNQDENHFASTIEIDIYIESLEKAYAKTVGMELTEVNDVVQSPPVADTHEMITARRGMAICFSQDPPSGGQSFYDFVKDHGCRKNSSESFSYWNYVSNSGVTGNEGSTSGNMWSITPTQKAIRADMDTMTTTAKNFCGVLLIMTPEGPALIPSTPDGNTTSGVGGWFLDDNKKDVQIFQDSVYSGDTGLDDIVGKWIRLVFKTTPDGWTCYGPASTVATKNRHSARGIYNGDQHTLTTSSNGYTATSQSTHSMLQVVDLGSNEIIKDKTLFGEVETDHYRINNHYVPGASYGLSHGSVFGANSLQHWPKNLSIWSMNYKNDKNVNKNKDTFMDGPSSDTSTSIFIDTVKFNNFNLNIKNCSAKKFNPNAAPIKINPASTWAGPDVPKIDNDLLTGTVSEFETNAPNVLSFGFKNKSDICDTGARFKNFTDGTGTGGTWLLFNGYTTANLGANEEIPDCNIRFGYSGGDNGENSGGDLSGSASTSLQIDTAAGDGSTMNDFYVLDLDQGNSNLINYDHAYDGQYLTFVSGQGKGQTRKIVKSNYSNVNFHQFAVQPMLANVGTTSSYMAITPHVFGNQFRNEGIGSHKNPGKAYYGDGTDGIDQDALQQKAMFTSRAHSTRISATSTMGDSSYWDWPNWRYSDNGWGNTVGTAASIDTGTGPNVSGASGHLAKHGYGTAQAGTSTAITLQSDMSTTADAYNGMLIIIEGGTGVGQIREITDYTTGREATVNKAWDTTPDSTSKYRLRAAPYVGGWSDLSSNSWLNVSSGTHNNWTRKYQNVVTEYEASGSPNGNKTDLQGAENNNARFESKWFDTGFSEKGGSAINANTSITINPHAYQTASSNRRLHVDSDSYFPIRVNDTISMGSFGQTGQLEMPITTLPSAGDLDGDTAANLVFTSATALPAALGTMIDRPIYTKLPTSVNNFNRKGFAHFNLRVGSSDSSDIYKRENLAASARITEIKQSNNTQITLTVDNANTLSSDDDEEYIVYLYGQMATMNDSNTIATVGATGNSQTPNAYSATGLKIISRDLTKNTITLLWDGKANNGDLICTYDNLPALMISPWRYWVYLVIDCTDETGQKALNSRQYKSVSWMESNVNNMAGYLATGEALGGTYDHAMVAGTLAARQNLGSTWNEYKFNDATVANVPGAYINDWELTRLEKGSSLDCNTDFGWGPFTADGNLGGYCGSKIFYKNEGETQTENIMELPYIVQKGSIEPKKDITLLLAFEDESLPHTLTLKSKNAADSTYDPCLYSVYFDERPTHPKLSVMPDEQDAFIPNFKWEAGDEDLWYGLLHIDNRNIPSQYHNMIGYIPLNEDDATTFGGVYFENAGNQRTSAAAGAFTNTRCGLAGWAKEFNGTNQYLEFADATNFAVKPSSEMTIVLHAIPDNASNAQETLLAKHTDTSRVTDYEIYIDTDEKVNAKITPASGTTLHLKSNTILPRDGETPVSIIVTFDSNIKGGNMKLFIDGKLEDQSGLMDATGTSSNLKTGQSINQGSGKFYIGCSANGTTEEYFYDGKIEEVVIYNKCLYPVNPKDGQFKLTKPLREVENGSPISYQGRLFVKDYHNIRGSRTIEVASSSPVSFAKAGFRLS